eukprot:s2436_g3.t1
MERQRNKDGVPTYGGEPERLPLYKEDAIQYAMGLEYKKRYLAGPRLLQELTGVAKTITRTQTLKDPQWLSHPRGVFQLLEFLESELGKPSLVEASRHVMKFFYNMSRQKGESMTEWIARHSEGLWEASAALRRVQREYGGEKLRSLKPQTSSAASHGRQSWWDRGSQHSQYSGPFRDDGRLDEDDDVDEAGNQEQDEWWHRQNKGWEWSQSGGEWSWDTWRSSDFEPPSHWDVSDEIFIPEFLAGFLLLHRSGLDPNEKANILGSIKGEFSTRSVGKALREQWSDQDLARRDKMKANAAYLAENEEEMDADEALEADEEHPHHLTDEDFEAYVAEQDKIQAALAAIRAQKATLQEARWKQKQIKLGRKFFPEKPYEKTHKTFEKGARGDVKCFRCGGPHFKDKCPLNQAKQANVTEEAAEIVFGAEKVEQVYECQNDSQGQVVSDVMSQCMGIIDSGATASLGSIDALEHVQKYNLAQCGDSKMTVDLERKPIFKFGNGAKKECVSTVHMAMTAGDKKGAMEVHVHDAPQQPVLVSRRALGALGAIIDFQHNKAVYANIDPSVVVSLTQAPNGHLLMPLTGNLLAGGIQRSSPFLGLDAE